MLKIKGLVACGDVRFWHLPLNGFVTLTTSLRLAKLAYDSESYGVRSFHCHSTEPKLTLPTGILKCQLNRIWHL